jgi:DNA-binding IclR family transcriptional regulator
VGRAVDVLNLFGREAGSLGVTEIAMELGLAKAVVHRILQAFKAKGYVDVDPVTRRYRLGPAAMVLGLSYLDRLDVRTVAHDALRQLSAATNETATLSVRFGDQRVYVDQVNPSRDVQMVVQLGRPFPLHAGASSRAFLAFLPDDEQKQYLSQRLEQVTDDTLVDPAALRAELRVIRAAGFAKSIGESDPGTVAAAAPVFDRHGDVTAVMSVCGPRERLHDHLDAAGAQLRHMARETSRRLGHR